MTGMDCPSVRDPVAFQLNILPCPEMPSSHAPGWQLQLPTSHSRMERRMKRANPILGIYPRQTQMCTHTRPTGRVREALLRPTQTASKINVCQLANGQTPWCSHTHTKEHYTAVAGTKQLTCATVGTNSKALSRQKLPFYGTASCAT